MRAAPFLAALILFAAAPGAFCVSALAAPDATPPAAKKAPAQKPPAEKPAPKPSEALSEEQLFAQLAKAQSAEDAKPIEDKLQTMFKASGSPSVDLLMNRAEVAAAAKDEKMARKLVESVTAIAPKYAEGWHVLAAIQTAAGDDAGALVSLQKTVALNPRQFQALSELAGMLEDYGDKPGALKLYRRALALDPQLEGLARHLRALTREVEGQDI